MRRGRPWVRVTFDRERFDALNRAELPIVVGFPLFIFSLSQASDLWSCSVKGDAAFRSVCVAHFYGPTWSGMPDEAVRGFYVAAFGVCVVGIAAAIVLMRKGVRACRALGQPKPALESFVEALGGRRQILAMTHPDTVQDETKKQAATKRFKEISATLDNLRGAP
jgi:hypothetical protein